MTLAVYEVLRDYSIGTPDCSSRAQVMRGNNAPRSKSSAAGLFFSFLYDISSRPFTHRTLHCSCQHNVPIGKNAKRYYRQLSAQTDAVESPLGEEPAHSTNVRNLMRSVPQPVVIATSSASSAEDGSISVPRGMTVSSFTTVTLMPDPIVTFNIRKPSTTLDAIRESRKFNVHMLRATHSASMVARAFTKGNIGETGFQDKRVRHLSDEQATLEAPLLEASGINEVLQCQLLDDPKGLIEVGDHVLVLGSVKTILVPVVRKFPADGLLYMDRTFRSIGRTLKEKPYTSGPPFRTSSSTSVNAAEHSTES